MFVKIQSAYRGHSKWLVTLSLVCAIYFIAVLATVLHSRQSNYSTAGVTKIIAGPQLSSGQEIRFTFPGSIKTIDDLVLFMDATSYAANVTTPLSISLQSGTESVTRRVVIGSPAPGYRVRHGNMVALIFDHVNVSQESDMNIELALSVPENFTAAATLRFSGTQRFLQGDVLTVEDTVLSGMHLMVQTHHLNKSRLLALIAAGCIVILLCSFALYKTRFHLAWPFLATMGLAVTLAEFGWQARLGTFYGWFWPDRYVEFASVLKLWFTGAMHWEQLMDYTATFRNAHAWSVPALIATISLSGLSYVQSYSMLNILAFIGVVGTWALLFMRSFPESHPLDRALFMVAIALHYLHLSVGTSLLTDILSCFFISLFFLFFSSLISDLPGNRNASSRRAIVLSALALYLSLQTRIAMVPLILAPVALLVWVFFRNGALQQSVTRNQLAPIVYTVGLALVLTILTYTTFNLFDSIVLAKNFTERFSPNNFNIGFFFSHVNTLLIPAYAALLLGRFATFNNNIYSLIWIFVVGYLCMLYLGKIPTWPRYLAPLAAPVVFYCLSIAKEKTDSPFLYRLFALCLIGYHVYLFSRGGALAIVV